MWNVRQGPERGSKFNLGAQVLRALLERLGWSQTRLKRELGTEQAISHWLFGDRCPGLGAAVKIRNVLGLPVDLWLAPPASDAEVARIVDGLAIRPRPVQPPAAEAAA